MQLGRGRANAYAKYIYPTPDEVSAYTEYIRSTPDEVHAYAKHIRSHKDRYFILLFIILLYY